MFRAIAQEKASQKLLELALRKEKDYF